MTGAVYDGFRVTVYAVQSAKDGLWTPDIRLISNSFERYSLEAAARFNTREEAEEYGLKVGIEWATQKCKDQGSF